ncbi:MAG: hypothetical protein ACI4BH_04590 [Muribaculaceae bacterium]
MKKLFILIVLAIAVGALVATNPTREAHVAAVNEVVGSTIEQNLSSNNPLLDIVGKVGSALGSKVAGNVVDENLDYCNYYLFSLSRIKYNDKNYYLSVGALGTVKATFNEKDLEKAVNSGINKLLK